MKQIILVRKDLKMSKGKVAVQVAHGSVEAVLKSDKNKIKQWRNKGMKKITLSVNSENEIYRYLQLSKNSGLITALIKDAGKTEIKPGTITVLAIGPDEDKIIDNITGNLTTF